MTKQEFIDFNSTHTQVDGEILDCGDFRIWYDTGEYVTISSDYDGIIYTHQGEDELADSMQLFKELREMTQNMFNQLQEKYSIKLEEHG